FAGGASRRRMVSEAWKNDKLAMFPRSAAAKIRPLFEIFGVPLAPRIARAGIFSHLPFRMAAAGGVPSGWCEGRNRTRRVRGTASRRKTGSSGHNREHRFSGYGAYKIRPYVEIRKNPPPKVGLRKLKPLLPGECRCAVAIREKVDLWLTQWVTRS